MQNIILKSEWAAARGSLLAGRKLQRGRERQRERERERVKRGREGGLRSNEWTEFAELAHIQPHSMNGWLPRSRNINAPFVKLEEQVHQHASKDENNSADRSSLVKRRRAGKPSSLQSNRLLPSHLARSVTHSACTLGPRGGGGKLATNRPPTSSSSTATRKN